MDDLLPGKLGHYFLVSIVDAALVSTLAFWWYRRAVRRLMGESAAGVAAPAGVGPDSPGEVAPRAATGTGPLVFALSTSPAEPSSPGAGDSGAASRRLAIAYGIGAAVHATGMVLLQLGPEAAALPVPAWFSSWWINLWPLVPSLMLLLALDRFRTGRAAAAYLIAGAVLCALVTLASQVARRSFNTAPVTNVYYMLLAMAVTMALPLGLVVVTGWRRIRMVMPLALAATLLFGMALLVTHEAMTRAFNSPQVRRWILDLAALTSHHIAYYGPFMLVALPVGGIAWWVLIRLASGFEHKQFSDVQLIVDCWWFVVTMEQVSTTLAVRLGLWALPAGLAVFAAYRASVSLALRLWPQPVLPGRPRLLLLRVFGYQARTEALFDRIVQRWRFRGPVQLIAGVDLATKTADPGDMLAFIQGHLDRQYVSTADAIADRLAGLDLERDPDGRHRVNEIYCHADTWRPALQALLGATDMVLMDLRSFSPRNAGCIFELEEMMKAMPTDQIVFVYDRTTDLPLLGTILSEAWAAAQRTGRARGSGRVGLVRVERQSRGELGCLMRQLTGEESARIVTPQELSSI